MSKNKSKIVKWEYVTEPFDVLVLPALVKRVHAPIEPSLSRTKTGILFLHLRPCVQGVDEYGAVVKYLYCTRDGRFFVKGKDGWNEIKYDFNPGKQNRKGGSDYPCIRNFGNKNCHLCVAYAWHGARPEGMVCDHLDGNKLNMHADNLQWITADENRRRAKIARLMRQIGLDPKLLTPTLCKGIYGLPRGWVSQLLGNFLIRCNNDPSQLSVENIRIAVACSLDEIRDIMKHVKCKEPDDKKAL